MASNDIVVKTEHLTKTFGKITAVNDLNLEVRQGQIFGFLGPNGAGKSTTISMILGLVTPTSGNIEMFGLSVKNHLSDVLCYTGAVMDNPGFYPYLSGWDNLKVLARISCQGKEDRIDKVLHMVDLADRSQDKFSNYSQGMKQRLAIAGALLHDPKFIIFDEPTNGLDPAGMKEIRELIIDLGQQGKTIFLNSHLLHEVEQVCDHVVIIKKGKVIASGTPDELIKHGNTLQLQVTDTDKALVLLKEQDWITSVTTEDDVIILKVSPERATDISRLLAKNDVFLSEMKAKNDSLESIFLELTGEEAVD
ncbi:MAG: ABC transporter ATP-binding protein [Dehalococcoidales bacterium]|nr:ABC transporter ATP-binding protein [Dehalococcoidales bacterium]